MVKRKEPFTPALEDGSLGDSVDQLDAPSVPDKGTVDGNPDWLGIARDCYEDSTRFLDSSLRWQWERAERSFQGRHPPGSKYLSDTYKHRSKLYRPKTRTTIRQGEAAAAASFFSNQDVISVQPLDDNNDLARVSADINKELLQYRLTTPSPSVGIPWFVTCVGAYQDAEKYGVVCSKQWWEYREHQEEREFIEVDPQTGEESRYVDKVPVIERDRPRIDLIPPENIRIDRAADWRDPVNTSPFVIILHPMYIHEVEARMNAADPKTGQPQWKKIDRGTLKAAGDRHIWDSTRSHREGNREDSKEPEISVDEYFTVWVHENIVRWGGRDYVYYTAGTFHLLSDPKPIEEVYAHAQNGERPLVMGYCLIETNKLYPSGKPRLVEGLQQEANELVNLRLDNVKLALNKRYKVRRGRQVDLRSLLRNAPGSVTLVNELDDVDVIETRDVTASAYQEQDRINVDFDDIIGAFTPGTVQTNRRLNETVGGLQMLSGAANVLGELDLRVFTESWVEPVLRQVLHMEQHYETDIKLIALAGARAQLYQKYGVNEITDEMLGQDLQVRVNVGIGATDPVQRLNKFRMAAETVGMIFGPSIVTQLNAEEVIKEIFGSLGYRDGSRFFKQDGADPVVQQLMAQLEEMQRKLEGKEMDAQAKIQVAQIGAQGKVAAGAQDSQGRLQQEALRGMNQLAVERQRGQSQSGLEAQRTEANYGLEAMRQQGAQGLEQTRQQGAQGLEQTRQRGAQDLEQTRQQGAMRQDMAGRAIDHMSKSEQAEAEFKRTQEVEGRERKEAEEEETGIALTAIAETLAEAIEQQAEASEASMKALQETVEKLSKNDEGLDKVVEELRKSQEEQAKALREALSEMVRATQEQGQRRADSDRTETEGRAVQQAVDGLKTSSQILAAAAQGESLNELAEQLAKLAEQLAKPKRVVRDKSGRVTGVE